jgi:hypothetical protein
MRVVAFDGAVIALGHEVGDAARFAFLAVAVDAPVALLEDHQGPGISKWIIRWQR